MARSTEYDAFTGAKVRHISFVPHSFEGDELVGLTITFEDGRWIDIQGVHVERSKLPLLDVLFVHTS